MYAPHIRCSMAAAASPPAPAGRRGIVEYCDSEETVMELSREGLESLVLALEKGGYGAEEVGRLAEAGYTTEHLAGVLQGWLDSADRSNGFIRIEWF